MPPGHWCGGPHVPVPSACLLSGPPQGSAWAAWLWIDRAAAQSPRASSPSVPALRLAPDDRAPPHRGHSSVGL